MDFPFGPARQTALDYFEQFLTGTDAGPQLQRFIDEARRSRLGLHQDVMRAKNLAKFRELFTGNVISAFPSIEEYGKGEILLARTMTYGDDVFIFGNTKGFPKEAKKQIEDMVLDKLFDFTMKASNARAAGSSARAAMAASAAAAEAHSVTTAQRPSSPRAVVRRTSPGCA